MLPLVRRNLLLVVIAMTFLVIIEGSTTKKNSSDESCSDISGKFSGSIIGGKRFLSGMTCAWVAKRNTQWRCKNIENVSSNCPDTCDICNAAPSAAPSSYPTASSHPTATASPSAAPSSHPTASPTKDETCISKERNNDQYNNFWWCEDSNLNFDVDSVKLLRNGQKSCLWASNNLTWRCNIEEVQLNCPALCSRCGCTDNPNAFLIGDGETEWRCDQDNMTTSAQRLDYCNNSEIVIRRNCPKTCKGHYII